MTVLRGRKDPRTPGRRAADDQMIARIERGEALAVEPSALDSAARRVLARNQERRREVARLGAEIAALRRTFGLTQEDVARAIGTSKPNICALERGRAAGISLERFMAVIEALREGAAGKAHGAVTTAAGEVAFSPTAGIVSVEQSVEAA